MMYVCQACKGESASKSNRMKPSTCDDCFAENPIIANTSVSCACQEVGHDKDKIPRIRPMSKSLESQMKAMVGNESVENESRRDEQKNSL